MKPAPICPYCHQPSKRVSGADIYPHRPDLAHKVFYQCAPCDAYVGCHPNTTVPLGRLANAELRAAKMKAHAAFDPIWQSKRKTRTEAYDWLSKKLGIVRQYCHIGMFNVEQCELVVVACREAV